MKKTTSQKESFNEREFVASARECTGLIPALTDADPDAELNESWLYAIHAPKKRDGKREEFECEGREEGEHS